MLPLSHDRTFNYRWSAREREERDWLTSFLEPSTWLFLEKSISRREDLRPLFHAEDIELSYRIKQEGFKLVYEDSARVYHKRRNTVAQFIRQLFNMGKARVTLARLHPGSLEPLHVLPTAALCFFVLLGMSGCVLAACSATFSGMLCSGSAFPDYSRCRCFPETPFFQGFFQYSLPFCLSASCLWYRIHYLPDAAHVKNRIRSQKAEVINHHIRRKERTFSKTLDARYWMLIGKEPTEQLYKYPVSRMNKLSLSLLTPAYFASLPVINSF